MRITYFLTGLVAATLHASSTALTTTKNPNQAVIANVVSPDTVDSLNATEGNGNRMLRKVEKNAVGDGIEEERGNPLVAIQKWFNKWESVFTRNKSKSGAYENKLHRERKAGEHDTSMYKWLGPRPPTRFD